MFEHKTPEWRSACRCESAPEFLDQLRLSGDTWTGISKFGEIGFRGQSRAYSLTPSAFRKGSPIAYDANGKMRNLVALCSRELVAVRRYLIAADQAGLRVAGDSQDLRDPQVLADRFTSDGLRLEPGLWPPHQAIETLSLAQHHGVPTRLLDFSYDPLIAAYFAAWGARRRIRQVDEDNDRIRRLLSNVGSEGAPVESLQGQAERPLPVDWFEVWAFDLRPIRIAWETRSRRPRLREVTVSRTENGYLQAQKGFFLLDQELNYYWHEGALEPLDAAYLNWMERLKGEGDRLCPVGSVNCGVRSCFTGSEPSSSKNGKR